MNTRILAALLVVVPVVGCTSSTSGPDPVPSVAAQGSPSPAPTPTPTPTPTPVAVAPTPTPAPDCDRGLCEAPITNTNPPVRLTIRLYSAVDGRGKLVSNPPVNAVPLSYRITLDAVAKDAAGYETNGGGKVNYDFSNPGALSLSGTHPFQVKVQASQTGEITAWAELDGVRSNDLNLIFIEG